MGVSVDVLGGAFTGPINIGNEAITTSRQCLDKTRRLRVVSQGRSDLLYAEVQTMLKVDKSDAFPDRLLDLFAIEADEAVGAIAINARPQKQLNRALEEPVRQIANNAGHEGSVVVQRVKASEGSFGFNADTEQYEDLSAAGVIDPTKVVRSALQNASSVAGLMLTTETLIAEKPKKEDKGNGGGHDHGGGGYED